MNLAIKNTRLLTFKGENLGIIDDGAIGIDGSKICFIGESKNLDQKNYDKVIDGSKHVIMPGLVNAHIHTVLTILRGGAQDLPELQWMNKGIGPISKHMKSEDFIVGAKLGVLEGLKSGTTTFAEYTSNVSILVEKVFLPFNARVVATETINEVNRNRAHLKPTDIYEFDKEKGEAAFKRANELFAKYQNSELVNCMYGPQAIDMISLDLLSSIREEAIARKSKIYVHVAQGGRERLQIQGRFGKDASTVKVLDKNNLLDENLLAAHCHDTSEDEREIMVKKGVKMVGCPSSICMIDGIVPPVGHFNSLGGDVGLGSDQAPGPGLHNMFCEMRTISVLTKAMLRDPTALPAWEVLRIATVGGAKILGLDSKIGSLEVGKQADVIMVNLNSLNLAPAVQKPFRNYIPNLVYSSTGYEVDNVIINGKEIIVNKNFVSINQEEVLKEANLRAQRIFGDATEDWTKAGSQLVNYAKKGFL